MRKTYKLPYVVGATIYYYETMPAYRLRFITEKDNVYRQKEQMSSFYAIIKKEVIDGYIIDSSDKLKIAKKIGCNLYETGIPMSNVFFSYKQAEECLLCKGYEKIENR